MVFEQQAGSIAYRKAQMRIAATADAALFDANDQAAFVQALTSAKRMHGPGQKMANRSDKSFQIDRDLPVPVPVAIALAERDSSLPVGHRPTPCPLTLMDRRSLGRLPSECRHS